jgi:thiosulfate dehydrogenase [quinone] large subunit
MLVAFVESIKYVGHLLPIAFLRIFLGYFYFNQGLGLMRGPRDFLSQAYLAEDIRNYLARSPAPEWYKAALETIVIPNWHVFAVTLVVLYLAIGVSYIIGYFVRPFAIIAIMLCFAMLFATGPGPSEAQAMFLLVLHFTLGWMGAGRCLGIDYYFYKRRRGVWW